MGTIGKISPIQKKYSDNFASIGSSLSKEGFNMFPGTYVTLTPYKEKDGTYRTGLDPEAFYIKAMEKTNPDAAKAERERVIKFAEQAHMLTGGADLSPRSDYYSKMFDSQLYDTGGVAKHLRLYDQANTFNLHEAQTALTYYWARVHPEVAPSYEAWSQNHADYRCPRPAQCKFFVEEEEVQTKIAYSQKTVINKAIASLEAMDDMKARKTAILLGLPVGYNSTRDVVYNEIDNFIKESERGGNVSSNVTKFNQTVQLAEETFEARFMIKEALVTGVYRVGKYGVIFNGQIELAKNEEELLSYLLDPSHQDDYLHMKEQVRQKRALEVIT